MLKAGTPCWRPIDTICCITPPVFRSLMVYSLPRHVQKAEEMDLHLLPYLLVRIRLEHPVEAIPRIANDYVHTAKCVDSSYDFPVKWRATAR